MLTYSKLHRLYVMQPELTDSSYLKDFRTRRNPKMILPLNFLIDEAYNSLGGIIHISILGPRNGD